MPTRGFTHRCAPQEAYIARPSLTFTLTLTRCGSMLRAGNAGLGADMAIKDNSASAIFA